ncbi:MAG TPA: TSUP family transporter [Vicinamibacterales bacterium]|nr:TSUP family transporter [Vicinamibacterales bacterium]
MGIGSFATTTTAYKLLRVVPDERMVGTILIGHSLPVVVQAFIFLVVVQVDPAVLASLIAVSVFGSWMGAGVASKPANFIFGALLMLGIGNYAPSLILFSVLGMDPRAAFPIMMSSGAMMAMVGGLRFMNAGRFDTRAALGLTLGGIPGVLVAGLVVRSLPLSVLRWVVVFVVVYAATTMLRSAFTERRSGALD